ncbi:tRNA (adenosine(37)-N6)-threonylcarbamoyltransferase complex dimerization subunit type 1 TsaB [Terrimonas pollutisoli]|uniref:tRNA (adenosine(37)-N6)-threonylcarbamoyltransferase complex dimerization subunit type 1 TsaB n=1 Tax=Terrimonas pollutisoli TaxID=3034147 RepID=UPI0023EC570C|nr:tRNA (adenosine(37)-N6)-threonylcarbamoyltransferase complex dimerization subunit type 1 TsaB [Terrimonas sp. H1YJ31]
MGNILHIDTAVDTASFCLMKDGEPLLFDINNNQKDHAAWLHTAIQKGIAATGLTMKDLDAIAISIGPGSYTGLRVGLSAAKGFSFALDIPLITVNTLEMMAHAVPEEADLICPMIDARRMEVFTALYDKNLQEVAKPSAMILDSNSFSDLVEKNVIAFTGNGREKLKKIFAHPHAIFSNSIATAKDMVAIAEKKYVEKNFANLAYVEPFYIKEFHTTMKL